MDASLFNKKLLWAVFLLSAIIIIRLGISAQEFNNWRGFIYSTMHVLIVAIGSFLAIKKKSPASKN